MTGKVALVTGAAMGIGYGIAARFREAGASVYLADIDAEALARAAVSLNSAVGPGGLATAHVDVADMSGVEAAVLDCSDRLGGLDVLVNNAGIYPIASLRTLDSVAIEHVMRVNVNGSLYAIRAFAELSATRGSGGSIVNLASMEALHPSFVGMSAYGASKGAVVSMTMHAALELAPLRIRVNAIAPGAIITEGSAKTSADGGLTEDERQRLANEITQRIPAGRLGQPDDVATVAVFLASEAARYITGQTILTDGGLLLT